jgi:hypothetical protein
MSIEKKGLKPKKSSEERSETKDSWGRPTPHKDNDVLPPEHNDPWEQRAFEDKRSDPDAWERGGGEKKRHIPPGEMEDRTQDAQN